MEIFIGLFILWVLFGGSSRYRFWTPLRGSPDLKSTDDANRVTDHRIRQLNLAGRLGDAIAVTFGMLRVPLEVLSKPVIIFGMQGSGKTSLLNMILNTRFYLELFRYRPGRTRFVKLDIKNESPARLDVQIPEHVPIHYLNPLDARASVLNYPKIFTDRSDIGQLAHSICPPIPGDQSPFFRDSARQAIAMLAGVLQTFQAHATRPWGLNDLCAILSDKKLFRRVMFCDFEARSFYKMVFATKNKASADVYATIRSVIQPLIPAALAELGDVKRFDLSSFVREDGVVILGVPSKGSQAVLPIYAVIITRLIEEALTVNHPDDRLFLVLDEIAMCNRSVIDAVIKACSLGRASGIHVIAATQSVELLESQFSEANAHAFLASCGTTVAFRCASKKTADYCVSRMGRQEGIVLLTSWTQAKESSTTTAQHLQVRDTVLAEELLHAPLADPIADSMTFWSVCPTFGNVKVTCPFVEETTVKTDPSFPNTLPRTSGATSLRPFTEADWIALGLPHRGRTQTPRSS
ncbi:MAG: type IV secretion system DNA-binding domain-containing protein [Gemmataceae bacterium]